MAWRCAQRNTLDYLCYECNDTRVKGPCSLRAAIVAILGVETPPGANFLLMLMFLSPRLEPQAVVEKRLAHFYSGSTVH